MTDETMIFIETLSKCVVEEKLVSKEELVGNIGSSLVIKEQG